MNRGLLKVWREYRGFAVFIVLMMLFRSALADWNVVPTGSMKPTILEGDRILVNKLAYDLKIPLTHVSLYKFADPQRGDIVVFDSKAANTRLVKRVIGLPGDTVELRDNRLTINGIAARYSNIQYEVDATFAEGVRLIGAKWHRKQDRAGVAFVSNGIKKDHQIYLADGGLGF